MKTPVLLLVGDGAPASRRVEVVHPETLEVVWEGFAPTLKFGILLFRHECMRDARTIPRFSEERYAIRWAA